MDSFITELCRLESSGWLKSIFIFKNCQVFPAFVCILRRALNWDGTPARVLGSRSRRATVLCVSHSQSACNGPDHTAPIDSTKDRMHRVRWVDEVHAYMRNWQCWLVVACTVWTHRRLLSSDNVKVAGQKRGPSSAGRWWCTGFWTSQVSSGTVNWYLPWEFGGYVCMYVCTPCPPKNMWLHFLQ